MHRFCQSWQSHAKKSVCEEKHSRGETVCATQLSTGTVTRAKTENRLREMDCQRVYLTHSRLKNSNVIKMIIIIGTMYLLFFRVLYPIINKRVPIIASIPEVTRINPNRCAVGGEIFP